MFQTIVHTPNGIHMMGAQGMMSPAISTTTTLPSRPLTAHQPTKYQVPVHFFCQPYTYYVHRPHNLICTDSSLSSVTKSWVRCTNKIIVFQSRLCFLLCHNTLLNKSISHDGLESSQSVRTSRREFEKKSAIEMLLRIMISQITKK